MFSQSYPALTPGSAADVYPAEYESIGGEIYQKPGFNYPIPAGDLAAFQRDQAQWEQRFSKLTTPNVINIYGVPAPAQQTAPPPALTPRRRPSVTTTTTAPPDFKRASSEPLLLPENQPPLPRSSSVGAPQPAQAGIFSALFPKAAVSTESKRGGVLPFLGRSKSLPSQQREQTLEEMAAAPPVVERSRSLNPFYDFGFLSAPEAKASLQQAAQDVANLHLAEQESKDAVAERGGEGSGDTADYLLGGDDVPVVESKRPVESKRGPKNKPIEDWNPPAYSVVPGRISTEKQKRLQRLLEQPGSRFARDVPKPKPLAGERKSDLAKELRAAGERAAREATRKRAEAQEREAQEKARQQQELERKEAEAKRERQNKLWEEVKRTTPIVSQHEFGEPPNPDEPVLEDVLRIERKAHPGLYGPKAPPPEVVARQLVEAEAKKPEAEAKEPAPPAVEEAKQAAAGSKVYYGSVVDFVRAVQESNPGMFGGKTPQQAAKQGLAKLVQQMTPDQRQKYGYRGKGGEYFYLSGDEQQELVFENSPLSRGGCKHVDMWLEPKDRGYDEPYLYENMTFNALKANPHRSTYYGWPTNFQPQIPPGSTWTPDCYYGQPGWNRNNTQWGWESITLPNAIDQSKPWFISDKYADDYGPLVLPG